MNKNTSISLGNHFDLFAHNQVKTGGYNSVSEVIRSGLRLLEEKEMRLQTLRNALEDGERSSKSDYSLKKILQEIGD
ncbi:MAG: type II toxin-antitoxin system ParD family antitoxin [Alphaproteobacteria bacterium]